MMKKQEDYKDQNKVKNSQKQHEEPWLGNPDDHEPTRKVERDEVNP